MKTQAHTMAIERDVKVQMREGVHLFAMYRPTAGVSHPVIMSVTPYRKDKLPDGMIVPANFPVNNFAALKDQDAHMHDSAKSI